MSTSIWFWIAFHVGVFIAIALDLFQFKMRDRELSIRAAAQRSVLWVLLSLGFSLIVARIKGPDHAIDFLTGYVIEYSLSVDNIFIFVLIFSSFGVPPRSQHRVLVWGIVGALVMRGIMILLGVALVSAFHWILYVFGVFLIITGIRTFFVKDEDRDFSNTWLMRISRRSANVTNDFREEHFTARENGRFMITPLALVLIMVDMMDLVFAVDSIPAVFAITTDTFIVYTSNICAIVGLRSLYFLLAGLMNRFVYLKTGLSIILVFVGTKMMLAGFVRIPTLLSLVVIVAILTITIAVSMVMTRNRPDGEIRK